MTGKPSRSAVFGRAGLWPGKMLWLRQQPDLRISVLEKLATALQWSPETYLRAIRRETQPKAPRAPRRRNRRERELMTRRIAGETLS